MSKSSPVQILFRRDQPTEKSRPLRPARKRKFSLPAMVFEFQPEYILGARLSKSARKVVRVALGDVEAGAIVPSLSRPNFAGPEEVGRKVVAVAHALGSDRGPFGVVLPDAAVRVTVLEFETLPPDRKEQEALIRWKMKPLLPFPVEEARLSFEVELREPEGIEAVVMAVRKSVAAEYESALNDLSGDVALVLPSSAALLPLLSEDAPAGELLMNISPTQLTAVVAKGRQIRLWRNQATNGTSSAEGLAGVTEEAVRTLAAAHDHLGLEIDRLRICARPRATKDWADELSRRVAREVKSLTPDPWEVGTKLTEEEGQLLEEFGATVAGLLANAG